MEHAELIKVLLSQGADATIDNAIRKAASRKNGDNLLPLLLANNARGDQTQGCIATAASVSNHNSIEMLLVAGADIDMKWAWGNEPLAYAVARRNVDTVRFLLDRGANIDAIHEGGRTTLTKAINEDQLEMVRLLMRFNPDTTMENPFQKAAARPNGDRFLTFCSTQAPSEPSHRARVAAAVTAGNIESIKLLLAAGAEIEAPGPWGNKRLALAVMNQKLRAV
jgi:ankyrin repeat protein